MYSFSYLEPGCCSMSSCNCCFLTCIQISQEAGQVVWYSHLFQNFLQNFSLIPRMLIFTHVISCFTIFSLPWFMDLTFQVLMQYCSLQHWTLLFPPDTSTMSVISALAQLFILSGAISPFFLNSILETYQPEWLISWCHIFLPLFVWFLRQKYWSILMWDIKYG